ncbi:hypothetical protein MZO42_01595 [Sphingomonas psychrotolerans]|uniref:Uncharacterized protein n=1 Tax=Sphingomonas psychrotolerans TaxID=1327635 RepID=A0ABU3N1I7_9SPHN|nr:hypothetical protein [Sphingomonas psychrotolerans]MDT8757381.1 hypothetical protein [Sphingomonas psychrotolerans]
MSIEAIAGAAASATFTPTPPNVIQAGPNASVSDITSFQGSLSAAGTSGADALGPAMQAMFSQIERVNGEAKSVSEYAKAAQASGSEMTPGEVVDLTMKCHEFMFHCQLTSNIANRTSDGIQQLFRQQS